MALVADRDFAVVADPQAGLLTPDVGPPGTRGRGADGGAIFGEGLLEGLERGLAEFTMDFVLVDMRQELVEKLVGAGNIVDLIGGQERGQAFLPVVVAALGLSLGLGRGGIAEVHAVEVEGGAKLGEGVGVVGVEEGVEVHVKGQRQAVGLEHAGQKVEMGEEGFGGIEAGPGVEACGVVEDFEEDLLFGKAGQPGVGCGVVLPERAVIARLPAFDGLGRGFVAGIGGEFVFQGPTADAGAVGWESEAAVQFAGDGAVGAGRCGGEEFGGESDGFRGPIGVMIAAGEAGRPGVRAALSAGEQIVGAELVAAADADAQFERDGGRRNQTGTGLGEEMADEGSGGPMGELLGTLEFFMARKLAGRWI